MDTFQHLEGRGKLISVREIMSKLSVSRSWLRKQEHAGMPHVCLNPDSSGTQGRRYRYDLQAVMDWLAARNATATSKATPAASAEAPTPCATAEQKGVEA